MKDDIAPPKDPPHSPKLWRWPRKRIVRAAYLAGAGWSFEEIAADSEVRSNAQQVGRNLRKAGLDARNRPAHTIAVPIKAATLRAIEDPARRRRVTPEQLLGALVKILAHDPALLANVLDDGA